MTDFFHPFDLNISQKDPWRLFKIMSEFVSGFDSLATMGPCVSMFGSSRVPKSSPYHDLAQQVSYKVAEKGFSVITGGGPGLMTSINEGAKKAKAHSAGLLMDFPDEDGANKFVDRKYTLSFRYFFVRKVMFVRYAQGFVFMPGGFGTLDELFEIATLIQTKKTTPVPVFLAGSSYWKGLMSWLEDELVQNKYLPKHDLKMLRISDDPDEIADTILTSYQHRMKSFEVEEIT